ncbi:hypothetical protein [Sediminibacillus albus]|uniref:DUF3993 domain-containing protein n=1 Tax=Sediminibacillus albus TaxID=407036 RepID=A0A1G8Z1I1_9BACI|nr:hypothetical protein [Sediminibacillus albus]SDK08906.1 hypothetical protein SAMN05216243_1946 [Sediminibacillus albus]
MKKQSFQIIAFIALIFILSILTLSFQSGDPDLTADNASANVTTESNPAQNEKDHREKESQPEKLDHEHLTSVTKSFMDKLVQETTESFQVKNFDSKEELIDEFGTIASPSVAEKYIDVYYTEKADGLYLLPTETPPWFQSDSEYEMMDMENGKVKVIQENQTELYGSYKIELELTFTDSWKITNTKHS